MKKAHYQIHHNAKGFFFLLVAANNKTVGGSFNEYYPTKAGCKQGIVDHHVTTYCAMKDCTAQEAKTLQSPEGNKHFLKLLRIVDKTK